jgi:hypothetical protein
MPYTTANATTTAMAQEYVGDEAPVGVRADAMLRDAERIVAGIAPPPDPRPTDYVAAASDAELRIFEAISLRKDRISSQAVGALSVSYKTDPGEDMYEIVRQTMARWIPAMTEGVSVAVVSPVPW